MPKTVLIADDNAMVRKILLKIFEIEQDYNLCAEAVNGKEAIAIAKQCKPDLIILDYSMPAMNGIDAARELKRIMPAVPIILFTLHTEIIKHLVGLDPPFDLVVAKSDATNLLKHVRSLMPA